MDFYFLSIQITPHCTFEFATPQISMMFIVHRAPKSGEKIGPDFLTLRISENYFRAYYIQKTQMITKTRYVCLKKVQIQ